MGSQEYRRHAQHTLEVFVSLMDDLLVRRCTGEIAETFRDRLKLLPAMRGKGIYAGMSPFQALTGAERLRAALESVRQHPGQDEKVRWGEGSLTRKAATSYAAPISMRTANKYLTVMTAWGGWMEKGDERSTQLHRGKNPFSGKLFAKTAAKKEARLAGRSRTAF